jgi:type IV pilus assembly protein PilC
MVGEKTGTLENILKTFADFYDEEVDYTLRTLTTFLEPAMLLTMGLIIGFIVMSVLLPIYQFVGKFI